MIINIVQGKGELGEQKEESRKKSMCANIKKSTNYWPQSLTQKSKNELWPVATQDTVCKNHLPLFPYFT